ncbi:uncharacterized protein LOC126248263 [Schistocerca nitens]|uniref:uncharacterized protein LOC126248263 n=1 Tax=Schistocerca nitens TaxID=7011 RepID=UPI0021193621|nr:uncharacterized protein LOC126248263 [Schistocerca nitens]
MTDSSTMLFRFYENPHTLVRDNETENPDTFKMEAIADRSDISCGVSSILSELCGDSDSFNADINDSDSSLNQVMEDSTNINSSTYEMSWSWRWKDLLRVEAAPVSKLYQIVGTAPTGILMKPTSEINRKKQKTDSRHPLFDHEHRRPGPRIVKELPADNYRNAFISWCSPSGTLTRSLTQSK